MTPHIAVILEHPTAEVEYVSQDFYFVLTEESDAGDYTFEIQSTYRLIWPIG